MIEFDWQILWESFPSLVKATQTTLLLLFSSCLAGLLLATSLALGSFSQMSLLRRLIKVHIFYFRGTPLLAQIFLLYYGSAQFQPFLKQLGLWFLFSEPWFCAFFSFTLNTSAYLAEIIRGGIKNLPVGEIEAAKSFGMGTFQTYRRIILPRAFAEIVPFWGNEVILMLKATSLASTITLLDLMGMARRIASDTFAPLEVYLGAGLIYLVLTGGLTLSFKYIEKSIAWRAV